MTDLQSIQALMKSNQLDAALAEVSRLCTSHPDDVEALYTKAVCQRYLRAYPEAQQTLRAVKKIAPEHGRAHQEEGHLYRAQGQSDRALTAYARACHLNPALVASYRGQIDILLKQNQVERAQQVKRQLEDITRLAKPLLAVSDLIAQGKLAKAEALCRRFLHTAPRNVDAMCLLAEIGLQLGALEDAEYLLESATLFEPDNARAAMAYIRALQRRQKFPEALAQAKNLLAKAPETPGYQSIVAVQCMHSGDFEGAFRLFNRVLKSLPKDPVTLTSLGHVLKTSGKINGAIDAYHQAISHHPGYGEAYYALANLKTYQFTEAEIAAMHSQQTNPDLPFMDLVYLNFALGKAEEDRQNYDSSFAYYSAGNAAKKAQSRYLAANMSEELAAQRRVCSASLFNQRQGTGYSAPDPIFIVGLPRAGSTLLEQILSSHSQIDGTLELPNILSLASQLRRDTASVNGEVYPASLPQLSADKLHQFGKAYIEDTRMHRQGAAFFIDKMPNNFRHIGLIKLILPNAKVIDARRSPMACCFSGFKQLFAEGQEFTYDLRDIGVYYRDYVQMMAHWDEVLPGFVLRVQHEDVVKDLETEVRRMLSFCNLPFEDTCLKFHQTERLVRTPSSEQVRQPIFTSALAQWRHYEQHLAPLRAALGDELARS